MKPLMQQIDELACNALRQEVMLDNKPGLVCPSRQGSHVDMNCTTFQTSIDALQGYFGACFKAGFEGKEFRDLQRLGVVAEKAMFNATQGVNTHKGAIFMMGLLAGAAGVQYGEYGCFEPVRTGRLVAAKWGVNILLAGVQPGVLPTHGRHVKNAFGLPGAREQAAQGFPVLFATTVPQLHGALSEGASTEQASLHALVSTMATLPDTNLAHRGGLKGLLWAQRRADLFLAEGGVFATNWRQNAAAMCTEFEAHWLSPGGSADLLSAALFVQSLAALNATLSQPVEFNR